MLTNMVSRLTRKVRRMGQTRPAGETAVRPEPLQPPAEDRPHPPLPGSRGEHFLQREYGTEKRALAFYNKQMLDRLSPLMIDYIARQEMLFISTSDADGECDSSFRAGEPGFVRVLDNKHLIYPEYRGNGVMASLGNITENPRVGMLFVDFFETAVGLHVNGKAMILENRELLNRPELPVEIRRDIFTRGGRQPERWMMVEVEEAYIHCSKHIPLLDKRKKEIDWGTDDQVKKGGDHFAVKKEYRPWSLT